MVTLDDLAPRNDGSVSGKITTEAHVRGHESYSLMPKTIIFGLHFCRRHYGYYFNVL